MQNLLNKCPIVAILDGDATLIKTSHLYQCILLKSCQVINHLGEVKIIPEPLNDIDYLKICINLNAMYGYGLKRCNQKSKLSSVCNNTRVLSTYDYGAIETQNTHLSANGT